MYIDILHGIGCSKSIFYHRKTKVLRSSSKDTDLETNKKNCWNNKTLFKFQTQLGSPSLHTQKLYDYNLKTIKRFYPATILEHRCWKYASGYMGHFIPNFKLKLLNKWICFIICTSYLTTEKVCSYFQNSPKFPALEPSNFFSSLCQQCFIILTGVDNGTLTIEQRILTWGPQIMSGLQEVCEPPDNLQNI